MSTLTLLWQPSFGIHVFQYLTLKKEGFILNYYIIFNLALFYQSYSVHKGSSLMENDWWR